MCIHSSSCSPISTQCYPMDHKSLLSVMRLHGRCYNYHSLFHFLNDIMSLFYRTFLRVSLKTLTRFLEDFISSALPILYVFSCSLHLENDLGAFLFCLLAFLLAGFLYLLLVLNISLSSCKKKKNPTETQNVEPSLKSQEPTLLLTISYFLSEPVCLSLLQAALPARSWLRQGPVL